MEPDSEQYYLKLAAAFVRGRDIQGDSIAIPTELREKRLDELEAEEMATVFRCGLRAGLKLHKFKKTAGLLKRNRTRSSSVPETVMTRLANKLDVPDVTEAHRVEWSIS